MSAVTMSDLAREAKVSKNTVSLALRHDPQIPLTTQERIEQIAQRLGYKKNPTVAHLMVQLRCARKPGFKATLALLNANSDKNAFRHHPTIPTYVQGCRKRADELGYTLDEFWLHNPRLDGKALNSILRSRGIRGAIVIGLMEGNQLPPRFATTWANFPCVATGVRTQEPTLSFASTDHHALILRAFEEAVKLGYQRPALVIDRVIDQMVDGRFSAGLHTAQQKLSPRQRTRPFYLVNEAKSDPQLFFRWFEQEKPDCILTLYHVVATWIAKLAKDHAQIGLVQLEWRPDHADWAGLDQHNDIVGAAAVEMVIGMIHNGELGTPAFPRCTLIGSTWVPGSTASPQPSRPKKTRTHPARVFSSV